MPCDTDWQIHKWMKETCCREEIPDNQLEHRKKVQAKACHNRDYRKLTMLVDISEEGAVPDTFKKKNLSRNTICKRVTAKIK